ncbi:unnamed protein product [Vitrella brassicaformis CCMP3155]|uniref:Uncharacterized protein n=2 Tax=Vitrella brassicaformis TaxID=1169539 RepID=A0A0G4G3M0_VITBC|nr:unnamed protein product [Vitrella brassicaformis CCMP3155]|eukprot:CEM22755.1 unnamed protein product [Vitrella brassicaformis CCMP3155]
MKSTHSKSPAIKDRSPRSVSIREDPSKRLTALAIPEAAIAKGRRASTAAVASHSAGEMWDRLNAALLEVATEKSRAGRLEKELEREKKEREALRTTMAALEHEVQDLKEEKDGLEHFMAQLKGFGPSGTLSFLESSKSSSSAVGDAEESAAAPAAAAAAPEVLPVDGPTLQVPGGVKPHQVALEGGEVEEGEEAASPSSSADAGDDVMADEEHQERLRRRLSARSMSAGRRSGLNEADITSIRNSIEVLSRQCTMLAGREKRLLQERKSIQQQIQEDRENLLSKLREKVTEVSELKQEHQDMEMLLLACEREFLREVERPPAFCLHTLKELRHGRETPFLIPPSPTADTPGAGNLGLQPSETAEDVTPSEPSARHKTWEGTAASGASSKRAAGVSVEFKRGGGKVNPLGAAYAEIDRLKLVIKTQKEKLEETQEKMAEKEEAAKKSKQSETALLKKMGALRTEKDVTAANLVAAQNALDFAMKKSKEYQQKFVDLIKSVNQLKDSGRLNTSGAPDPPKPRLPGAEEEAEAAEGERKAEEPEEGEAPEPPPPPAAAAAAVPPVVPPLPITVLVDRLDKGTSMTPRPEADQLVLSEGAVQAPQPEQQVRLALSHEEVVPDTADRAKARFPTAESKRGKKVSIAPAVPKKQGRGKTAPPQPSQVAGVVESPRESVVEGPYAAATGGPQPAPPAHPRMSAVVAPVAFFPAPKIPPRMRIIRAVTKVLKEIRSLRLKGKGGKATLGKGSLVPPGQQQAPPLPPLAASLSPTPSPPLPPKVPSPPSAKRTSQQALASPSDFLRLGLGATKKADRKEAGASAAPVVPITDRSSLAGSLRLSIKAPALSERSALATSVHLASQQQQQQHHRSLSVKAPSVQGPTPPPVISLSLQERRGSTTPVARPSAPHLSLRLSPTPSPAQSARNSGRSASVSGGAQPTRLSLGQLAALTQSQQEEAAQPPADEGVRPVLPEGGRLRLDLPSINVPSHSVPALNLRLTYA